MFNINGPSGPTSRHERRVRNSTPVVDKKEIRRKMDTFFETKKPLQSSSKVGTTGTKDNKSKLYLDPKKSIFKVNSLLIFKCIVFLMRSILGMYNLL
jgi:hypothetical protein